MNREMRFVNDRLSFGRRRRAHRIQMHDSVLDDKGHAKCFTATDRQRGIFVAVEGDDVAEDAIFVCEWCEDKFPGCYWGLEGGLD
jgi:hypothetical protein